MTERPTIFVSAVSSELGSFRRGVCDVLVARGTLPVAQDHFLPDYREVRAVLKERIAECDAVICLIGFAYGAEPRNRPATELRRSYTQLEYDLARESKKPTYVFFTDDRARPCDAAPSEDQERRQLQLDHRSAIRAGDTIWNDFATLEDLCTKVALIPVVARCNARISPSRLRHGAEHLFGREKELAALEAAWHDPTKHVMTIVAWGGVGKTALIVEWTADLAVRNYDGARYFDWSFYSQGTREQGNASADTFIATALKFFGDEAMANSPASPWDKGARLAELIAQQRTLLILDGLEPLQYPPGPLAGQLKDPAVEVLLRTLAQRNPGLCFVTTREPVTDLAPFRQTTALEWKLDHLSDEAGAALLHQAGVRRAGAAEIGADDAELRAANQEFGGHALTLRLLGVYLASAHAGDIRKRHLVKFRTADVETQGGHAFRVMDAYVRWLVPKKSLLRRLLGFLSRPDPVVAERRRRQFAILRLLGLFDRPADAGCLAELRREPAIDGVTDPLVGLSEEDWNLAVSALAKCGLVSPSPFRGEGWGEGANLDTHPLIREYFAHRLREQNPDAWRAAHRRLYEHLTTTTEYRPDTLPALKPLYQAIVHACLAGLHQEACKTVYVDRILRGTADPDGFYSTRVLGAMNANLEAMASFFDRVWTEPARGLTAGAESWLLNETAFMLRAQGRLTEAAEPMIAGLARDTGRSDWANASISAANLSELHLTLGNLGDAVRYGHLSIGFADRSGEAFLRLSRRTVLADALQQGGDDVESLTWFQEAETLQASFQPRYPHLYSYWGFRYCERLLEETEQAAWRCCMTGQPHGRYQGHASTCHAAIQRAAEGLKLAEQDKWLLDIALDRLTIGRAILYSSLVAPLTEKRTRDHACAHAELEAAVDAFRCAGQQIQLPRGLLSRAWLRVLEGNLAGAQADLDHAWRIASRGPMRLHMADTLLYRARLFGPRLPYPWPAGPHADLAATKKLINECGYHRRDEELADAEQAAQSWPRS